MKQERTFDIQEFAQFISDRLQVTQDRLKGLHHVVNAMANEMRTADPKAAERVADLLGDRAVSEELSLGEKEVVDAYLTVLLHGQSKELGDLQ